jgi:FkbM family methyltransferase
VGRTNLPDILNPNRYGLFAGIKNGYLASSRQGGQERCFIIESDQFLTPCTLKVLIETERPVVCPMLRPMPRVTPYRNFYTKCDANGFFMPSQEDYSIGDRSKLGTFPASVVSGPFLIVPGFADRLRFSDSFRDWEFLAFARSAHAHGIPLYICNEREFGFFVYQPEITALAEQKSFTLAGGDVEVTPRLIKRLFSRFDRDRDLKHHVAQLNLENYSIYRVANRDLFFADDKWDWIKSHAIKQGAPWEPYVQEKLALYARPGSVAVDIGGHIGTHAVNLSRLVGRQGQVHVFEPQPKIFAELVVNMHLNGCKNVALHRAAVGNRSGSVNIAPRCTTNEGMARIVESGGHQAKMVRLDDLNLSNVSVIKIDVEGYESQVIEGARETIARNRPAIVIEVAPNSSVWKQMEELGYRSEHIRENDHLFVPIQ